MSWTQSQGGKAGRAPSFRTAAAAANLKQRQQQVAAAMMAQCQPCAQQVVAPPGYALVPLQQQPVVANATAFNPQTQNTVQFQCKRKACKAAQQRRPTFGTQQYCFHCFTPKAQALSPPLAETVEWARAQKSPSQSQRPQQSATADTQPAPSGAPPAPANARAARRQRQKQAKAAANKQQGGNQHAAPSPAPSAPAARAAAAVAALDQARDPLNQGNLLTKGEISAEVFADKKAKGKRYPLQAELVSGVKQLTELATLITDSLGAEYLPHTLPADEAALQRDADEELSVVLSKSRSSLETLGTLQQAETALRSTKESLLALQRGGATEQDPILKQLNARAKEQEKKVLALQRDAPSVATQREAHAGARQSLKEKLPLLEDAEQKGSDAATLRAQNRATLLAQLAETFTNLQDAAEEAVTTLAASHSARLERKKKVLTLAMATCDEKAEHLVEEDEEFLDIDDTAAMTATENELEDAKEANKRLCAKVNQLQGAVQQALAAQASQTPLQQPLLQPAPSAPSSGSSGSAEVVRPQAAEAPAVAARKAEDTRLAGITVDHRQLPALPPAAPEFIPKLERAWHLLELCQFHHTELHPSWEQLGLSNEECAGLLGCLWEKLYFVNDQWVILQPPEPIPRKVASLLHLALRKLASERGTLDEQAAGAARQGAQTAFDSLSGQPY